ncbi:MAG: asparagine synthase C-terminal domain-containing protein, partial [Thermoguttaceae bacterium]|nr:asparagine synthase C-terminal domain-containing protein [Thermoguttaceae bacterium]
GDGGDELFAGYDRYKAVLLGKFLDLVPAWGRRFLAGPVRWCIPASVRQRSFLRRVKRFLEALDMSPMERYLQWIAIFNRARKNSLYRSDGLARLLGVENTKGLAPDQLFESACGYNTLDFLHAFHEPFKERDPVTAISMTDLQTYLPGDLMTKVDMASMRHSLEVRAPFLDTRVVELAASMPIDLKLSKHGRGKAILRSTFSDFLPEELLNRPKTGFGVPLDYWFRGSLNDMLRRVLLAPDSDRLGLFNRDFVRRLIEEHERKQFDHAARLWSLLVFELWSRENMP